MATQPLPADAPDHDRILVLGMGGSGIGGRFLSGLLADSASVPVAVGTITAFRIGWGPPPRDRPDYSGNTEETLTALEAAVDAEPRSEPSPPAEAPPAGSMAGRA